MIQNLFAFIIVLFSVYFLVNRDEIVAIYLLIFSIAYNKKYI